MRAAIEWLELALMDDETLPEPAQRSDARQSMEAAYSDAKRAWVAAHPDATAEQYEAACQTITERLGV